MDEGRSPDKAVGTSQSNLWPKMRHRRPAAATYTALEKERDRDRERERKREREKKRGRGRGRRSPAQVQHSRPSCSRPDTRARRHRRPRPRLSCPRSARTPFPGDAPMQRGHAMVRTDPRAQVGHVRCQAQAPKGFTELAGSAQRAAGHPVVLSHPSGAESLVGCMYRACTVSSFVSKLRVPLEQTVLLARDRPAQNGQV